MTWIPVVPPQNAAGELQKAYADVFALYPPDYAIEVEQVRRGDGSADSIVAAHSLIPQALRHAMATYGVLLAADLPLTRTQHEMIATVVSGLNGCFY